MLKELKREDISYVVERSWALYLDAATRCYPASACKRDMELALAGELQNKDGKLLGYLSDGALAGVCGFYYETDQHYLRVLSLYAWDMVEQALEAFIAEIESKFAGYEVEIAIAPENINVAAALAGHGFTVAETCLDLRYDPFSVNVDLDKIEGIAFLDDEEDDEFEEYVLLHDQWFPDPYWNSQRLRELAGDWQVVILRNSGKIEGALLALTGHNTLEIEGLQAADEETAKKLMLGLLQQNELSEYGADLMVYMVRADEKVKQKVAYACGFSLFGNIERWIKKIKI